MSERCGRMDGQKERQAGLIVQESILDVQASVVDIYVPLMEATPTAQESVQDILRPLVEATVEVKTPAEGHFLGGQTVAFVLGKYVLDPRFDALRPPVVTSYYVSGPGIREVLVNGRSWTLDASLGAIVRAAAACGWKVGIGPHAGGWQVIISDRATQFPFLGYPTVVEFGVTPEEAAARALVTAWRDEKAASSRPTDAR